MRVLPNQVLEFDPTPGGQSRLHIQDGEAIIEKKFDAQPLVDEAAEMRAQRQGQRWGNTTHVGFIPMAVFGYWARHGMLNDQKAIRAYLKSCPDLCTFDKYLK